MSRIYLSIYVIFISMGLANLAFGAAGELDSSFDVDGIVTVPIPGSNVGEATGIVVPPDGKLIVSITANTGVGRYDSGEIQCKRFTRRYF